ncbi:hypothetical protein CONCODRAFT_21034 [Conidiobolus coronatus NRRL 28638]|uniref:Uncharacterized protein n=1 Tax=Conidiobolus coronatus (strain ATCC 28846 / CBS 209.66 / NRRL 28638) TaxID=796925 RepID=A0A137NPN1_CONC2|nr:hypothetical protein CONCODRAFT_21034 [Conidiobolus coronatus NRRL 28638]|eukprot:KXN64700.1 hypothetical protein CONCODRAFT_21034 [Conidiobolus coronatus NRRL 28638]
MFNQKKIKKSIEKNQNLKAPCQYLQLTKFKVENLGQSKIIRYKLDKSANIKTNPSKAQFYSNTSKTMLNFNSKSLQLNSNDLNESNNELNIKHKLFQSQEFKLTEPVHLKTTCFLKSENLTNVNDAIDSLENYEKGQGNFLRISNSQKTSSNDKSSYEYRYISFICSYHDKSMVSRPIPKSLHTKFQKFGTYSDINEGSYQDANNLIFLNLSNELFLNSYNKENSLDNSNFQEFITNQNNLNIAHITQINTSNIEHSLPIIYDSPVYINENYSTIQQLSTKRIPIQVEIAKSKEKEVKKVKKYK